MTPSARTRVIPGIVLCVCLLGVCGAGLWVAPTGFLPRLELARTTWERQNIHSYRLRVRWTYGTIVNGPWSLVVQSGRVISGTDLRTGTILGPTELRLAQQNLEIGALFHAIAEEVRPSVANTPRVMLARGIAEFSPKLRSMIDRCAPRLPSVDYHPARGYPMGVTVHGSPCYPASEWTVLISELVVLS
jgi:hypothetical protein